MPPALNEVSMSRATLNGNPPHQPYDHPDFARVDPQNPIHSLGNPIQQIEYGHFIGGPPTLAPQLAGAPDTGSFVWSNGQREADIPGNDRWSGVPCEGHGAFTYEFSERPRSGGAGEFMDFGYIEGVNESGLSAWTTSTTVAGEYGAQAEKEDLQGNTHGVGSTQSPYEPQIWQYIEQNRGGGEFKLCQSGSVFDDLVLK